jgi:hypothetical protein
MGYVCREAECNNLMINAKVYDMFENSRHVLDNRCEMGAEWCIRRVRFLNVPFFAVDHLEFIRRLSMFLY